MLPIRCLLGVTAPCFNVKRRSQGAINVCMLALFSVCVLCMRVYVRAHVRGRGHNLSGITEGPDPSGLTLFEQKHCLLPHAHAAL